MAEYIVDSSDVDMYGEPVYGERIVRCRDCKYANWRMGECKRHEIYDPPDLPPNGFCAWGEPKEGAND